MHDKIKNKENKLGEVQKSDIENTLNEIENEKVSSEYIEIMFRIYNNKEAYVSSIEK